MENKTILSLSFAIVGIIAGVAVFSSTIFATDIDNAKGDIIPFSSSIGLSIGFIQDEVIPDIEFISGLLENRNKPIVPKLPNCPPPELEGYENFKVSEEVITDIEVTPELLEKVFKKIKKNIKDTQESFEVRNNLFVPRLPTCPPQELEGYEDFEVADEVITDIKPTLELLGKTQKLKLKNHNYF